jgi:ABC-type lipoprotein release transport system permease subunit
VVAPSGSLRAWVFTLAIRRWRAQAKLFALVIAVASISGSVLSASLLLAHSAEDAGIRGALASQIPERVDVAVRVMNPNNPVSATRATVDTETTNAFGAGIAWTSRAWVTSGWVTAPGDVQTYLVELDDPSAAATLTAGGWPETVGGIALPEAAAQSLSVNVGDSLSFTDNDRTVTLRVDGLYAAVPESGVFWANDPLLGAGNAVDFAEPNRTIYNPIHAVGPLITAPGGVDDAGITPAQLEVTAHPTFDAVDAAGIRALRDRVPQAENDIAGMLADVGGPAFVTTDVAAALNDVDAGLAATRDVVLTVVLVLLSVVAVATAAVTRLLSASRVAEFDLMRARGAFSGQMARASALDGVAVAVVVAALSPWGGVLLHGFIVSLPPLDAAGLERWVLPTTSAWVSSAVVAVLVGALLALPSTARLAGRGRIPAGAIILAAQTTVIVAAVIVVWRVLALDLHRGDLLLAVSPAVLLIAIAALGSWALAAASPPLGALGGRGRGAVAPLAGWFVARGPGRTAGVTLVALAVGASVVVLGMDATWQRGVRNDALVAVGPPARTMADGATEPEAMAQLADGDSLVIRRQAIVRKETVAGVEGGTPGVSVQVLGLDADARTLLTTGVVAAAGGAAVAEGFPPSDRDDTGPGLPSDTAVVTATAALDAPEGVRAVVSLVRADAFGALTVVPLGSVGAGEDGVPLAGTIVPTSGDNPTRLVGITMQVSSEVLADSPAPITLTLSGLSVAPDGSAVPTPLALADAAGWSGSVGDESNPAPEIAVTEAEVQIVGFTQPGPAAITFGAVGWFPSAPIAAVVPATLADELDVVSDAYLTAFIGGTPVTFVVEDTETDVPGTATADDLRALESGVPTSSRTASTVAVDGRALARHLVEYSATGPLVDEVWHAQGGATSDGSDTVVVADTLAQSMVEAPLRAAIPASASVAVWASVLLAVAGSGAGAAATNRARRLEAAQLRAIGVSRRAVVALLAIDTAAVALAGVVVGLVGALTTLALVGTRLISDGAATPTALVVPWQAVTFVPLALLGVIAVIAVAASAGQRRLPLSELLRTGTDG